MSLTSLKDVARPDKISGADINAICQEVGTVSTAIGRLLLHKTITALLSPSLPVGQLSKSPTRPPKEMFGYLHTQRLHGSEVILS